MSQIDDAHAAMTAAPDDDAARLQFYERLADNELFLLLSGEPEGDQIEPELFEIEGAQFALVFDREERLTAFTERQVPYAGLSGRVLAQMIAGQDIGLALNLEVAPSAMLIPADAVAWLNETLSQGPEETQARLQEVSAPLGLPENLINSIDRKLALAGGLAKCAYLAAAKYDDGSSGHVLGFIGAQPGAEDALARAAGEALTFSGIAAGRIDVLFAGVDDALTARLAKVALRFDLPELHDPKAPSAPGMDPEKPPRLR